MPPSRPSWARNTSSVSRWRTAAASGSADCTRQVAPLPAWPLTRRGWPTAASTNRSSGTRRCGSPPRNVFRSRLVSCGSSVFQIAWPVRSWRRSIACRSNSSSTCPAADRLLQPLAAAIHGEDSAALLVARRPVAGKHDPVAAGDLRGQLDHVRAAPGQPPPGRAGRPAWPNSGRAPAAYDRRPAASRARSRARTTAPSPRPAAA